MNNGNRFMQFLIGLNENFDSVRDQVLVLDLLSSINRTYSMALKYESRKKILNKRNPEFNEILLLFNQSQKGKQKSMIQKRGTVIIII